MTIKQAKAILAERAPNMVFTKTDAGDYRVNFRNGSEATAYYSDDVQDAMETALIMGSNFGKVAQ